MAASASRHVDDLPADTSRFIGRRNESTAVRQLLARSRLVTLTGPGGVGKTRLAVHVARQARAAFAGGAFFIPLADLNTSGLLPTAVMSSLSHTGAASASAEELIDHLIDQEALLVFDNCEHLAADCAELIGELLSRCPRLHVLATSRERLRLDGEAVYAVPPLALPPDQQPTEIGDLVRFDGLALFVDRATLIRPNATLGAAEADAIAKLCRRFDGLPLAIELLAGRTASVPLDVLLAQADHLDSLVAGNRSRPKRQHTLRAAIDYSYQLCSEAARRLWARMSVFTGGCTLDAVEHVCGSAGEDIRQPLTELIDKSIVNFDGHRYSMLETIREYGFELLSAIEPDEETRLAHNRYFAALAAGATERQSSLATLQAMRAEQANLRAVFEHAITRTDLVEAGLTLAASMWPFWAGCGLQREGRHWLGELLARTEPTHAARLDALWVDGFLAALDGHQDDAQQRARECQELAENLRSPVGLAHAVFVRGTAELFEDRIADAVVHLLDAVRQARHLSAADPLLSTALVALGIATAFTGDYSTARQALEEAHHLSSERNDDLQHSWSVLWMGLIGLLDERQEEAQALLKVVLERNRAIGDAQGMSGAIEFLAWSAIDATEDERAAILLGVSRRLAEPLVTHLAGSQRLARWHEGRVNDLVARMGRHAYERAETAGFTMSIEDGIAFALARPDGSRQADNTGVAASPLTPREREVAELVASGMSNKQVAARLVIAERTAETHVEHILAKLGFTSRTQIVALYAHHGSPR